MVWILRNRRKSTTLLNGSGRTLQRRRFFLKGVIRLECGKPGVVYWYRGFMNLKLQSLEYLFTAGKL